jgi:hypothetical protein
MLAGVLLSAGGAIWKLGAIGATMARLEEQLEKSRASQGGRIEDLGTRITALETAQEYSRPFQLNPRAEGVVGR